jgi:hypothetical protein
MSWLRNLLHALAGSSSTAQDTATDEVYSEVEQTAATRQRAEAVIDAVARKTDNALGRSGGGYLDPLNEARRTVGRPLPHDGR